MNHIVRYESYSVEDRLDDVLDKISKYGISHLTSLEKEFLESFKSGTQLECHNKVKFLENEMIFEDDFGNFKFEHKFSKKIKKSIHHHGTIYINECGLEKCLSGKIIDHGNGLVSLDFKSNSGDDIFDFCSGIEYELDSFIDYIISEIRDKKNNIYPTKK